MEIPAFLMQKLLEQYGEETDARIVRGFEAKRATTLRVNRLKADAEMVRSALETAGIAAETVPWSEDALIVGAAKEEALSALAVYESGGIYLQSLSSMIPPIVLDVQAGENVLDMAAAPGGKTTQMAALSGNKAMITACERNKMRADRLRYNVEKQGASHVTVMNMDARQLDDLFRFDRILLDAPCSGSGTVCEGSRGQFSADYLARTVKMQRTMLEKALRLLRPGCEMVYSTCSILKEENEEVVRTALERFGAEIVPIDPECFSGVPVLPTTLPGTLCVCPDVLYEGFYVAKLRKKAESKQQGKSTKRR